MHLYREILVSVDELDQERKLIARSDGLAEQFAASRMHQFAQRGTG